jgi:hypothetical protein
MKTEGAHTKLNKYIALILAALTFVVQRVNQIYKELFLTMVAYITIYVT